LLMYMPPITPFINWFPKLGQLGDSTYS